MEDSLTTVTVAASPTTDATLIGNWAVDRTAAPDGNVSDERVRRTVMTADLFPCESDRAICGTCRGKKFDGRHRAAARKCQRCRGKGYTEFSRIKR